MNYMIDHNVIMDIKNIFLIIKREKSIDFVFLSQ